MYIDTSVAVKLYVAESDSAQCESIVADMPLISSRLLYCEFRSALRAKFARHAISERAMDEVWARFQEDIADRQIQFIPLGNYILEEAVGLLNALPPRFALRTLDALHLASYREIEVATFFTRDVRMREAAAYLGYPLAG